MIFVVISSKFRKKIFSYKCWTWKQNGTFRSNILVFASFILQVVGQSLLSSWNFMQPWKPFYCDPSSTIRDTGRSVPAHDALPEWRFDVTWRLRGRTKIGVNVWITRDSIPLNDILSDIFDYFFLFSYLYLVGLVIEDLENNMLIEGFWTYPRKIEATRESSTRKCPITEQPYSSLRRRFRWPGRPKRELGSLYVFGEF